MSDEPIVKPTDIETKNIHVTGGEAEDAIAEKIGIKNIHVTGGEADGETPVAAPLGNIHVTTEPAN